MNHNKDEKLLKELGAMYILKSTIMDVLDNNSVTQAIIPFWHHRILKVKRSLPNKLFEWLNGNLMK